MSKTVACIVARTNSTRLPQKVLRKVNDSYSLIEYLIQKIKRAKEVDEIYLCTSIDESDKTLLNIAKSNQIKAYAGSRDSVIERLMAVAKIENATNVVRITGDNIFTDEDFLDQMIKAHNFNRADYTRTEFLPVGVTPEIISTMALKKCNESIDPDYTQYLMLYMFQPAIYKCVVLIPPAEKRRPQWTLTVDTPDDWERTLLILGLSKLKFTNYEEIISIGTNNEIPFLEMKHNDSIKFPAGVLLSFQAYRKEMENRLQNSIQINL